MMVFRVIVFAFLALAGVALLLMVLSNIYPALGTTMSCRLYQAVTGIVPTPQETKPGLPWYCYPSDCRFTRINLDVYSGDELAEAVAFQAYRCWRCGEQGKKPQDVDCAELYSEMSTDESAVAEALLKAGHCSELPDNMTETGEATGCGNANSLFFKSVSLKGTIVIRYDSFAHRISVS